MEEPTRSEGELDFEEIPLPPLLQKIAQGETAAMIDLYDLTSRMLFGLVVRILPDRNAAEEVLLDAYSQVWRRAGDFNPRSGSASSWLAALVRARAIDRLRTGKMVPPNIGLSDPGITRGEVVDEDARSPVSTEWRNLVRTSLESLSPEQRQVIELAYYGGLSHSEIAVRIGQPPAAVKIRLKLGMLKLGDLLRPVLQGFR